MTPPAPPPAPETIEASVFLLGDAGAPARGGEPVLAALRTALAADPGNSTVVFLGDNVYPRGLPDTQAPGRAEAERRLLAQIDVVRETGARGVFVPGNHDWAKSGADGWAAIRRQGDFISQVGAPAATMLPDEGCPGPATLDVGTRLTLVALDTQWWLHPHDRPREPGSTCNADSPAEVLDSLRAILGRAGGRHVAIVTHHPLASGGVHGGHFGILDHLFPLRELNSWLWVPLPIIGSAYPLARMAGISDQDLPGDRYRAMRDSLTAAFATGPPLFYAAGHEHNLQVLAGTGVQHLLISGGGYFGHTGRATYLPQTRYAAAQSGFMRVDLLNDGRVRLGVVRVDRDSGSSEVFSMWLWNGTRD